MGSAFAYSPNIDALAGRGVLFTQAHSASPVCAPARCSIMTGLHAPLHGCIENGLRRRNDVAFFTDYLKQAGYVTIIAGKTHFGFPQSFDIQYISQGEKNSDSDSVFALETIRRGYSSLSHHPNPVPEEYCHESIIVDKTIETLEGLGKSGKPFFAFCSLLSPHAPHDPPGRWLTDDIFKGKIPPPKFRPDEWESLPAALKEFCGIPNSKQKTLDYPEKLEGAQGNVADRLDINEMIHDRELYYRSCAYVDSLVGRLMKCLDETGLAKNTLVIFTSDHGQQLFDHGFNDKHNYYDESLRIPCVMSLPGVLPENEKRGFFSHVDIAPTILAAAGLECDFAGGFDMFTPLKNNTDVSRNVVSPHAAARNSSAIRHFAAASLYGSMALVTYKWKLEYYYLDNKYRFYDRIYDPEETCNLADDPEYTDIKTALTQTLLLWRSGLIDTAALKKSADRGGPVAMRVIKRVKTECGNSNEAKVNEFLSGLL